MTAAERYTGADSPVVARLRRVADDLGPLREQVVFIGGAIVPLLQTQPVIARVRPTDDVDALTMTSSYVDAERLHQSLRDLKFRAAADAIHVNRWESPSGALFDLVNVGAHFGASGSAIEAVATARAVRLNLARDDAAPLVIRHADAASFLALKWFAYLDRGEGDLLGSHDIEDMIGVIASRPGLVAECQSVDSDLLRRTLCAFALEALSPDADLGDLLASHLALADNAAAPEVFRRVRDTLQTLAAL